MYFTYFEDPSLALELGAQIVIQRWYNRLWEMRNSGEKRWVFRGRRLWRFGLGWTIEEYPGEGCVEPGLLVVLFLVERKQRRS